MKWLKSIFNKKKPDKKYTEEELYSPSEFNELIGNNICGIPFIHSMEQFIKLEQKKADKEHGKGNSAVYVQDDGISGIRVFKRIRNND